MKRRNLLTLITITLLTLWGIYMLLPAYADHGKTRRQLQDVERLYLERQRDRDELTHEIHKLKTDPRAIERVARERFRWSRPGETIYDFQ